MNRRQLGILGEKLAQEHLKKLGYRLRQFNFRCAEGEIDIVAEQDDYLVFVEVRTKSGPAFGTPEESITASKKEKLIATAQTYLEAHEQQLSFWRIDVVAVELEPGGKLKRIEVIQNAVN